MQGSLCYVLNTVVSSDHIYYIQIPSGNVQYQVRNFFYINCILLVSVSLKFENCGVPLSFYKAI